jgi:hypothetical protein
MMHASLKDIVAKQTPASAPNSCRMSPELVVVAETHHTKAIQLAVLFGTVARIISFFARR